MSEVVYMLMRKNVNRRQQRYAYNLKESANVTYNSAILLLLYVVIFERYENTGLILAVFLRLIYSTRENRGCLSVSSTSLRAYPPHQH